MPRDASGKRPATPSGKDGAGAGRLQRGLAVALLLAFIGGLGYFALHDTVHARTAGAAAQSASVKVSPTAQVRPCMRWSSQA